MFLALVTVFHSPQPLLGERESDPGSDKLKRKSLDFSAFRLAFGYQTSSNSHVGWVSGTHPKTVIVWGGCQQLSRTSRTVGDDMKV